MRTASLLTCVVVGARLIKGTVEVAVQRGLPDFKIVGLAGRSVQEAQSRVRSALAAAGYSFPVGRVVVNLSPAGVPKQGTGYDLPIALGILMAVGEVPHCEVMAVGELGLSGKVHSVSYASAVAALASQLGACWVQAGSGAGLGAQVTELATAAKAITSQQWHTHNYDKAPGQKREGYLIDCLLGSEEAKRALLIALAGEHHVLLSGPPGVGKTALARAVAELLPTLAEEHEQELCILESQLTSVCSRLPFEAPYRAPHHTASRVVLLGGGVPFRPGEFSLAHRGVLFLDELPHFSREALEALREPLESHSVAYLVAGQRFSVPAHCTVIAARNLCPCGKRGMPGEYCSCTPSRLAAYARSLSGALLDRFPLHVSISKSETTASSRQCGAEYAAAIARVRTMQGAMEWEPEALAVLNRGMEKLGFSHRIKAHIAAVSTTISRVDSKPVVDLASVHEALQYRLRPVD